MTHLNDGRSIFTLANARPKYSGENEAVSVVVTIQDITPLEELERLRAEFLGMVGHELHTTLATIKGSTTTFNFRDTTKYDLGATGLRPQTRKRPHTWRYKDRAVQRGGPPLFRDRPASGPTDSTSQTCSNVRSHPNRDAVAG